MALSAFAEEFFTARYFVPPQMGLPWRQIESRASYWKWAPNWALYRRGGTAQISPHPVKLPLGGKSMIAKGVGALALLIVALGPASPCALGAVTLGDQTIDQQTSQQNASQLNQLGSSSSASIGAVACAEAANSLHSKNRPEAVALLGSCLNSFAAARKLKALELSTAANAGINASPDITPEPGVLNSEIAGPIFSDLEANYGIAKDDFVNRLIAAKGDIKVLGNPIVVGELFNGKVSWLEVLAAYRSIKKMDPAERDSLLASSRITGLARQLAHGAPMRPDLPKIVPKGAGPENALPVQPERSLASFSDSSTKSSGGPAGSLGATIPAAGGPSLTPLEDPLFTMPKDPAVGMEETIFEMVHRKYEQKFNLLHLSRAP